MEGRLMIGLGALHQRGHFLAWESSPQTKNIDFAADVRMDLG